MKNHPSLKLLTTFSLLGLSLAAGPLASARTEGSGHVVTEKREVSGIKSIVLKGSFDLEIVQDGTEALTLTGEDNLLPLVTTEVDRNHQLIIDFKKNESITTHEKLVVNVSVKTLGGLAPSGSGNVHAKDLKQDGDGYFAIILAGSGRGNLDKLEGGSLKVVLAGSGNVKIAGGTVSDQKIEISGSGSYAGQNLQSKTAEVSVEGSGDAEIWATDKLDVRVDGSGDVDYKGKPEVKKVIHGSGSVEPLKEDKSPGEA